MPLTIDDFDARVNKALSAVGDNNDRHARGQQMTIAATVAGLRFLAEVLLELNDQVAGINRFANLSNDAYTEVLAQYKATLESQRWPPRN